MATNNWTDSTANWNTPSDWSAGLPDSSSDVVINRYGNPDVTASFGTVATIDINNRASLTFTDAGASTVAGGATVKYGGALYLDASGGDGGSALTIGGRLTNSGTIEIGPSDNTLSAASTIEAAHLSSTGTLDLYGSSTVQAVLDVTSGAGFGTAETLTGQVNLSDDALIEFKGGQITTIAASGALRLIGSQAFVADASNTSSNSALKGLETVTGVLELEKGATVKTSGDLANGGSIALDSYSGGGGSLLNIKGTLTNSGTVSIGNSTLSANSSLTAASVVNSGTIDAYGDAIDHINATLRSTGAFTNDGSVNFSNDSDMIAGAVSGTGNFSLTNGSTLDFGAGVSSGETVTFGSGVDKLALAAASLFDGTINDFSDKGDQVLAQGFAESATTFVYTQTGADSCSWTLTDGPNTAVLNFAGEPYAQSDFKIVSTDGGAGSAIVLKTSIGPDDWQGGTANWDTPSDWSAGLPTTGMEVFINTYYQDPQVTEKFGTVASITVGNSYYPPYYYSPSLTFIDAGGSSVAGGVTNSSRLLFDVSSANGGSSLTIGGTLTNEGLMQIGPDDGTLSAASTVRAASLTNDGTIDIYGSSIARATLDVAAPAGFGAVGVLDGQINLAGQALAEFGSGQITTIAARSELSLTGPRAFVADASDTSSNSALSGLVRIDPRAVLLLADGASVTTSGALLNLAKIELDPSSREGRSSLAVGGVLRNGGTIQIGPADGTLSAASVVTAVKIANFRSTTSGTTYGAIDITGNDSANLAQPIAATLDIAGAAGFGVSGVLEGSVNLAHDGNVVFRGGQITTIAANSELTLTGRDLVVADASTPGSNSALRRLDTVTGDLNLSYGATVTTSGDLTSSGAINLDSTYGDGGSLLKINGALTNSGTIQMGNGSLSARSMVEAASVVNSGTIDVYGDLGAYDQATLRSTGAFTNDGSVNFSDDIDKIVGPVGGTGNFSLSGGSALDFGSDVSSGQTITFGSGFNKLILDQPSSFYGTIDDFFAKGDSVIAKDFAEAATTLLYTQTGADSCSWKLTDGADTAVLNFAGEPYAKSDFSVASANGGAGLAIKFV